ncbi:leucine transcriptional activator [Escherichia coli]|nr:leucine transcriptional activator [Escherichia coli]
MPEVQTDHPETAELSKPQLRMVDLNLLTVFDAVMQEQNITRAAHVLGMSQPAVSNAVARLKVMFNDELFVRYGRGIQPTARAFQLFGSVRQAGNDSNLLIVFYVQIMPDDFVMQLHRF